MAQDWYDVYLAWFNQNMARYEGNEDAQKQFYNFALAEFDRKTQEDGLNEQERKQAKAQVAQVAAAVGGPAALYLGAKWAGKEGVKQTAQQGLQALGNQAAQQGAQTVAQQGTQQGAQQGLTALGEQTAQQATPGMMGQAASNFGALGIGPQTGIVAGTALTLKGLNDLRKGREDNSTIGNLSRGQTALSTFGFSELARPFMMHKSTKDYQKERWGALSEPLQGLYEANHPEGDTGVWDTGKYAGQKWTFDKAKDLAKDDPTHFIGVLGNLETFGEDWLTTPLDKQKEVVKQLNEQNLYKSDKGDILISGKDQDKARSIYEQVLGTV